MNGPWGSVLTAMVTPFDGDGALDLDAAATLARWLADHGNDGLVVAGTTGEAPTLSESEKLDLWRAVSEAVTIPIVAGTGTNNTAETIDLTRRAADTGVAGVLVVGPYYNRPPQSGIEAHFRAVADATDLPLMMYDVPGRTGRRIAHDVIVRLVQDVRNVVAMKDATGDPPAAGRLMVDAPDLAIYSGDDSMTLPLLAVGAIGVVGVATHWAAPEFGEMIAAFDKGDVVEARKINAQLLESCAYENSETCVFSQAAKAMMRTLGVPVGECRLPLGPAPAGTEDRAREVYAHLRSSN
ncbi:MAG TPA: 4-hydroxy-tetrahydrodipicolinate synthase [Acidimicrobiales bacterium]|jgi:4-hydroxy-tetrahydrodipicolinate synthase|nr:4-hydroxy-tetrahydrodipicolinate synthase [Acidimicrobiales bacterium]